MCVRLRLCVRVYVCVSVHVCVSEREREREREKGRRQMTRNRSNRISGENLTITFRLGGCRRQETPVTVAEWIKASIKVVLSTSVKKSLTLV